MAENDGLPPPNPPAPAPPPEPRRTRRICCEFCKSELDPEGNVLQRGDAARAYLDLEDANKRLQETLDAERSKTTELTAQLEASRTPKKRGFLDL